MCLNHLPLFRGYVTYFVRFTLEQFNNTLTSIVSQELSCLLFSWKQINDRKVFFNLRVDQHVDLLTYLCNKNQLYSLFILSLFRQSTSTYFGHICSPSSGGIVYIYNNGYVLRCSVDCLLAGLRWDRPTDSQLNSTTRANCCIYTVYLLMIGYKYARNMQKLIDEIN